ncbi:AAA family ATPase [Rhodobacteraceae bacterium NNCM2]|nr:AAA family ATPase [Coraliihabitans acroporae]
MPDLEEWLEKHGLGELSRVLVAQDVEFDLLTELTNDDMRELGLTIGQRKKLQKAIRSISAGTPASAQRAPMSSAEKRQVTILFCDLVGSTRISQSLDPERMFELLGLYQRNAAEVISRYGGHVAQFLGDGVFVYFGYPVAHEDDSQRAILAAFDLIETTAALETGLDKPLAVRIGLDNGPAVIGDLRMNIQGDIDAIAGETPNRAAKIQSMASPNEVVIGTALKDLLGGFVTCEDLGLREVGSGLEPQRGWKVTGFSERGGQMSRRQHGVSAPLIGREKECALIDKAWEECRNGKGSILAISGEAGIGKSRLTSYLMKQVPKESRRGLSFFCSSYHQGTAFHPIADQLRRIAGITYRDRADGRLEKAQELLRTAERRGLPKRLLSLYEALIVDDDSRAGPMTPEERKARMISTLHGLLVGRAKERPVVLSCEDLQWCDPSTLATWDYLVKNTGDLPVLFVFTYRPEFKCPWENHESAVKINLERFGMAEAVDLIRGVASGKRLPEKVEAQLLEKADGVPLFVEELTRSLLSSGMLRERDDHYEQVDDRIAISIPATLNDALMTRLDRMNELREVTLWASALGRRFTVDQLRSVAPFTSQDLFTGLGQLTSADLLRKSGPMGHEIYEFRHALVREAAYNSMLASKRRRIHEAIIEGLSKMDPELPKRQPDLFYHHNLMSGNLRQAAEYAIAAGDLIAKRFKGPETRGHYQAACDLIDKFEKNPENDRLRIRAAIKLATSASRPNEIKADLARLDEAAELARAADNLPRLVQCLYWTARLKYDALDEKGAMETAVIAAELAEPVGDIRLRAAPENLLAFLYSLQGNPARGISMTERNSKDLEILGDQREATVMTGIYAFALGSGGFYERANIAAERAVEMAEDLGHSQSLSVATFARATVLGWEGRIDEAKPWVTRALSAANACRNAFQAYATHGWAGEALMNRLAANGSRETLPDAMEHLTTALGIAGKLGFDFHASAFRAHLAHGQLLNGQVDEARKTVEEAIALSRRAEQPWGRCIAYRVLGEIALAGDEAPDGDLLNNVSASCDHLRTCGLRPELLRTLDLYSRLASAAGHGDQAREARAEIERLGHAADEMAG